MTKLVIPDVSVKMFSREDGEFGWSIAATEPNERDFVLSCVALKIPGCERYNLYLEIAESEREGFEDDYRDGRIVFVSEKPTVRNVKFKEAGSSCFDFTKKNLGAQLGDYIRSKHDISVLTDQRIWRDYGFASNGFWNNS
tara:strand:+ start:306 stop:725 length:420 start_codon:yes stop_codon:yes gene_type:complete